MNIFTKTKRELAAVEEKLDAAERRIAELEDDLQTLEQSAALMVMTQDGLIERVTDELLALLNHRRDDLIGQHHRVLCNDEYARSEQYIKFWRELAIGRKQEDRFLHLTGDGREVWLNGQYLPVLSDKNLVKRVLVLMHRP